MRKLAQSDALDRLYRVTGDSLGCAGDLKSILADERTALEQQDEASLASNAALKDQVVQTLASLERSRGDISRDAGFGTSPESMDALIGWCDEKSMLATRWQEFTALLKQCNTMNSTNGAIILARRQQAQAALALLRGCETDINTYGYPGARHTAIGGRELAEA